MSDSIRISTLHELIAALDRRRPRFDHPAEPAIARDSAALKTKALAQIAVINEESKSRGSR
jgi:hypothetical protein